MAKAARRTGKKSGTLYGKDVEVIVRNPENGFYKCVDAIASAEPEDGKYAVLFPNLSKAQLIPVEDLCLPEEFEEGSGSAADQDQDNEAGLIVNERPYVITAAKIKDDYCHYSFGIIRGVEMGAEHNVKVDNQITEDLRRAFERFNVHLAVIDDVFKHAGVDIDDIDDHHGHDLTMLYFVTGFLVVGEEGDENLVLMGSKHVSSAGGRIDIKTPKIPLDNTSSYQWYNELRTAVDNVRLEVSLYKEGKFVMPEIEEAKPNPLQLTINDALAQNAKDAADKGSTEDTDNNSTSTSEALDEDFQNAMV